MTDRIFFLLYLLFVVFVTSISSVSVLLLSFCGLCILASSHLYVLLQKTLRSLVIFNSLITLLYLLTCFIRGESPWLVLLRLNLRVFTLTFASFLLVNRINLFRALGWAPSLRYLLTLSSSQIVSLQKTRTDFQEALLSRSLVRPSLKRLVKQRAALITLLFQKASQRAFELAQGMRSRGFFDV